MCGSHAKALWNKARVDRWASALFFSGCILGQLTFAEMPTAINANTEQDPEKIVEYIASWEMHYRFWGDGATKLVAQAINQGDWQSAVVHDMIKDGTEVLQSEFTQLAYAERLASYATSEKDKKKAAALLFRIYSGFDHDVSGGAKLLWEPSVNEISKSVPDVANKMNVELIGSLRRLDRDFVTPRAQYWRSRM